MYGVAKREIGNEKKAALQGRQSRQNYDSFHISIVLFTLNLSLRGARENWLPKFNLGTRKNICMDRKGNNSEQLF